MGTDLTEFSFPGEVEPDERLDLCVELGPLLLLPVDILP